jgi:CheY-like chemotaxis protein
VNRSNTSNRPAISRRVRRRWRSRSAATAGRAHTAGCSNDPLADTLSAFRRPSRAKQQVFAQVADGVELATVRGMGSQAERPCVIAVSAQPSVATFLRNILEDAGFSAIAVSTGAASDLTAEVRARHPDAIVYDIGFPFRANWETLRRFQADQAFAQTPLVITTGDAPALSRQVGYDHAIELFCRPKDLSDIRNAVFAAIADARSAQADQTLVGRPLDATRFASVSAGL